MDIFNLNISQFIPQIVDIYTELLGVEYRDIIQDRIERTVYINYTTSEGIRDYYCYLRNCKSKELGLQFLREIGVQTKEEQQKSYAEPYLESSRELLLEYLGSSFTRVGFFDEEYSYSGVKSFDPERRKKAQDIDKKNGNNDEQRFLQICQIRMINYLRGSNELNEENYEKFCQTEEFRRLKSVIEGYVEIYKRLVTEYKEYEKQIEYLRNYYQEENTRRQMIAEKYDNDWTNNEDAIMREYISSRDDYIQNSQMLSNPKDRERLLLGYQHKSVSVQELFSSNSPMLMFTMRDEYDVPVADYVLLHEMFHIIGTIIRDEKENLPTKGVRFVKNIRPDFISGRRITSGLDSLSYQEANSYNPQYRKYERLNETITDLFAIEARERLHSRGIFLLEDEEHSIGDLQNANTNAVLKEMIKPFVDRYKNELVQSIISGNPTIFINKIGRENYETINDCANAVDFIISGKSSVGTNIEHINEAIDKEKTRCKSIYDSLEKREHKSKEIDEER